ncbi:hypothetical protein GQ54DRAFT_44415 [Martensiomyces pterosporus]|nr:hypothetical protein GQ54DRAFT_44415 [Martensiomyces pterosporus]
MRLLQIASIFVVLRITNCAEATLARMRACSPRAVPYQSVWALADKQKERLSQWSFQLLLSVGAGLQHSGDADTANVRAGLSSSTWHGERGGGRAR